jgi:glycerophosphoryl diester phosphodiesterase
LPPLAGVSPEDSWNVWALEHRVPLLIRLPHGEGAATIPVTAGQLDIPPTVLALLGVPSTGEVMLGRDLLGPGEPLVVFRDGSVISGHHASIDSSERHTRGCFDVRSAARIDCELLAEPRRRAREQMEISDLVVRGDLVTALRRPSAAQTAAAAKPEAAARRRTLIVGHRGNPEAAPENTVASIVSAFAVGADFAEVDVRVSRDGVPVIFHDETLERTTNGKGALADHTLAELKALDAGAWKGPAFAGERIPTLVEALQAARGKGRLFLDVPVPGLGAILARTLQDAGVPQRDAIVATWDADQRRDIVAHLPGATIVHSEGAPPVWDASFFDAQRAGGVHIFDVGNWSPPFVRDAHAAGFTVWAYTINDPATMRDLVRHGIDAFETDVPRLAVAAMRETGAR